jgi:hypothetical protein
MSLFKLPNRELVALALDTKASAIKTEPAELEDELKLPATAKAPVIVADTV